MGAWWAPNQLVSMMGNVREKPRPDYIIGVHWFSLDFHWIFIRFHYPLEYIGIQLLNTGLVKSPSYLPFALRGNYNYSKW